MRFTIAHTVPTAPLHLPACLWPLLCCCVVVHSLLDNDIGAEGALAIASALKCNSTLQELE